MAGVWVRLFSAVRGGVNEAAEAAADTQALRILDQEIRDAEAALRKAQTDLAGLMGRRRLSEQRIAEMRDKLSKDEALAGRALSQNREDLAREVAGRMATLANQLAQEDSALQQIAASETKLKDIVSKTRQRLETLKREVETVKVTESVQKAQSAIAHQSAGVSSKMNDAMSSLERIKQRQATNAAKIEAADELAAIESGGDLDKRLLEAGIGEGASSADDILARIRAQSTPQIGGPQQAGAAPRLAGPGEEQGQGG